ncbi:MAG TPA: RidA family protein [Ktedonosporobacter sp.]|nr:RidA family protein [Ktedonosporobacter sp.]
MSSISRKSVSSGSPFEPRLGITRAVRIGDLIAVGGTAPIGPDGTTVAPGDAAAQAQRCLEIIRVALEGLGADLSDVIRTRILLTDIEDWMSVAQVHGAYFGDIRPVTTVMQVTRFADPEWLIEIEVDAYVD